MGKGYVKLYRKLQDNWLWQEKRAFSKAEAWIDILMMVNHKENKVSLGTSLIPIEPGSRIISIRQLCERWRWSNTKVKSFLDLLTLDKMIVYKSDTKKTVISVVNWELYQGTDDTETSQKHHENVTDQSQKHTNKNDKNDKNIFSPDGIEYRLSNYLFQHMKRNNPTCKEPDFQKWCKQMDYILRIDKRDSTEVKTIIEFCQKDSFWKTNILSVSKLREKYDQLNVKRLESRKDKPSSSSPTTNIFEKTFEDDM